MTQQVQYELHSIREMPYGTARTAAAEALARRIETEGPQELLATALLDLVEAYSFSGEGDKSFVVFARALRLWDERPELFDERAAFLLFWQFKWIAADLTAYPQITATQAEAFFADMQRRFELAGHGTSTVRLTRFLWAWLTGHNDTEQARLDWVAGGRDEFDDCSACTIGLQVNYFVSVGRYQEAVELGVTQRDRCNREPARTHYITALAALRVGDAKLALDQYQRALASDGGAKNEFTLSRAQGFQLLAEGGQFERALRVLRNDLADSLRDANTPSRSSNSHSMCLPASPRTSTVAIHRPVFRRPQGRCTLSGQPYRPFTVGYVKRQLSSPAHSTNAPAAATSRTNSRKASQHGEVPPRSLLQHEARHSTQPCRAHARRLGRHHNHRWPLAQERAHPPVKYSSRLPKHSSNTISLGQRHRLTFGRQKHSNAKGGSQRAGWRSRKPLSAQLPRGDEDTAHTYFEAALPRLTTGRAAPETVIAVIEAWAPIAAAMQRSESQIAVTAQLLASYDSAEPDLSGLTEELAARRQYEWQHQRTTLRDILARSQAAAGETDAGITAALRAGEEFAGLGLPFDAAHAFWLAGILQRDTGDSEGAIWSCESAFEGFTVARCTEERAHAASDLIELLRSVGLTERAEEVVANL